MTHRATREDTIQSIYIYLLLAPSIFAPTISFPSVVQPRIEFRPPPSSSTLFTSGNKCTYDSIMRPESWPGKNARKIEYNCPHSIFRDTHRGATGDRAINENGSRNRSGDQTPKDSFYPSHIQISFFLFLSLSLCRYLFAHNHVQSPLSSPPRGLFQRKIWEQVSRGGDSRRRFPTV